MTSVVTSSGQLDPSETVKKRVQIAEGPSGSLDVSAAQKSILSGLTPGGEFPSTAELMHKCMAVNPFEAKFAEANRRMTGGMSGTLESNGLVPMSLTSVNPPGSSLLKFNSLSQSPGIFSNISILTTDVDGGGNENLKTADISKLLNLQQSCGEIGQAPRTADVLNSVLDMHQQQDRLHTVNYLPNFRDISSIFSSLTPSGSAPNSASILNFAATSITPATLPSTSGGLLSVPLVTASPAHSPRQQGQLAQDPRQERLPEKQRSPNVSEGSNGSLLTTLQSQADWDPRDVKPQVSQIPPKIMRLGVDLHSLVDLTDLQTIQDEHKLLRGSFADFEAREPRINFFDHDGVGAMAAGGNGMPTVAIPGESNLLQLDALPKGEASPTTSVGRGRGRGRAAVELPADERRMTILERNKAAAVRYRKRKKEEHDDMIGRVHGLEQEKNQLSTQNQVLRQELERVTALLRQREVGCHCMKGRLPLSTDLIRQADSPIDVQQPMYIPHANLMNGLQMPNGLGGLKRPKM